MSRIRHLRSLLGSVVLAVAFTAVGGAPTFAQVPTPPPEVHGNRDVAADSLLGAAATKLKQLRTLTVDAAVYNGEFEKIPFQRQFVISLERPNRFRYEAIAAQGKLEVVSLSDGRMEWILDRDNYIAYQNPVRPASPYHEVSPIVQYFFHPRLEFDAGDPLWGIPVSAFDTNEAAYDKYVTTRYLGEKSIEDMPMKVVRVQLTTRTQQLRRTFYLRNDQIMMIIASGADGRTRTFKFRNYRSNPVIAPGAFTYAPPKGFPVQPADPARLGQPAPDFALPLAAGGELNLREALKGKRGLLVTALDGTRGMGELQGPDAYLAQMRLVQSLRDKFSRQGLEVVAVVGGKYITPDVTVEMMRNWMPDISRFNYPVAIDVDLERGIQGSAYQNFQVGGRRNVLLDHEGRVVFACTDFDGQRVNEVALYQALAQIGFTVSPADLDDTVTR